MRMRTREDAEGKKDKKENQDNKDNTDTEHHKDEQTRAGGGIGRNNKPGNRNIPRRDIPVRSRVA